MSEFINTIDVLGDDAVVDGIIQRTITEFKDNVVSKVGQYAFYGCASLTNVDLPAVTEIENDAFNGCTILTVVVLRNESHVCNLSDTNAFADTPIASGTGYAYVPRAWLSDDDETKDYRRATNWSTYASQFRALEDYTVDGTITGELDETKI